MTRRSMVFRSTSVLASIVALTGCSPTVPPVTSKPPSTIECKGSNDSTTSTQTLVWGADSLAETAATTAPNAATSTVISLRGQMYLTIEMTVDVKSNQRTAVTHFGKAFSGMREMILTTVDGELFSGTLDGKPLKPFAKQASPEAFADGSPLPAVGLDAANQSELTSFLKAIQGAPNACQPTSAQGGSANRPLYADATPGYHYNPTAQVGCLACIGGCIGGASACEASVIDICLPIAASAATYAPIAYGICLTLGTVTCFVASRVCRSACLSGRPGFCCPTDCQKDGVCCDAGDSCLNTAGGMCCHPDHPNACGGRSCCLATDQCIASTGACCAQGSTPCGGQCCQGSCNVATGECCPNGQSCISCGARGQSCCTGNRCVPGSTCSAGTCRACPAPPTSRALGGTPTTQFAGNNCIGVDFTHTFGGRCDDQFRRGQCTATVVSSNDSRAFCQASWESTSDPTNCICRVHFQAPSDCNGGIQCSVHVTETQIAPPLPQDCPQP